MDIDMFHLWSLAEQDLLSDKVSYRLRDTGQGLNRVQPAPKTSRMMHAILHRAQKSVGSWVGSSAIHLGDENVPNALMFLGLFLGFPCIMQPATEINSQLKTNIRKYIAFFSRYATPFPKYHHLQINPPFAPTSTTSSDPWIT